LGIRNFTFNQTKIISQNKLEEIVLQNAIGTNSHVIAPPPFLKGYLGVDYYNTFLCPGIIPSSQSW
jgi:hypothetical protein